MHTAPPRATPRALRTVFASELPKPDQPPELPVPPQKLTGREDSQIVDRLPEEVAEVSPIEREKDIGARERAEEHGLVFGCLEDNWPVERELIGLHGDLRTERDPGADGIGRFVGEVFANFVQDPRGNKQTPALAGGVSEKFARGAGGRQACGDGNAAIEEEVQRPCRKRSPSASSSASMVPSSSSE